MVVILHKVVEMVRRLIFPVLLEEVFADGFLWGAKVKGDGQGDEVRVGGSTYNRGWAALVEL